MAVHLLYRSAAPAPVSPVRRSARLVPHIEASSSQELPPPTRKHPRPTQNEDETPINTRATASPRSVRAEKRQRVTDATKPEFHIDNASSSSSASPPTPAPNAVKPRATKRKPAITEDEQEKPAPEIQRAATPIAMKTRAKRKSLLEENKAPVVAQAIEAPKPKSRKRKSVLIEEEQSKKEQECEVESCPPVLKRKRKENTRDKPTPGDNNQLQIVQRSTSLKGKEREVINVLPLEPPANARVVSLRPRRRSAGSIPSTRASTSSSPSSTTNTPTKSESLSSSSQAEPACTQDDSTATIPTSELISELNLDESKPTSSPSPLTPLTETPTPGPTPTPTPTPPSTIPTVKPPSPPIRTTPTLPSHPTHSHTITQPHIPSPLSPKPPKSYVTTPPSSPILSPRASPPLDAVDLGPLLGLTLPSSAVGAGPYPAGSHTVSNPISDVSNTSTSSSPPISPIAPSSTSSSTNASAGEANFSPSRTPVILPTIPSTAAAFLGPFAGITAGNSSSDSSSSASNVVEQDNHSQPEPPTEPHQTHEQPEQLHHFAHSYLTDEAHGQPLDGASIPLLPINTGISMPMNMGMGLGMGPPFDVGLDMTMNMGMAPMTAMNSMNMTLSMGGPPSPLSLPLNLPMGGMSTMNMGAIPASESELGFGFQPQEAFVSIGGSVQQQPPQMSSEGQQHEQPAMSFGHQQGYAPEAEMMYQPSTSGSSSSPAGPSQQQDQAQQLPQQVQEQQPLPQQPLQQQEPQRLSMPLTMKQQRKLTYPAPNPLEFYPKIERDGSMWSTACKLRVWEISKRYTPDTIRTVVAQEAHAYYETTGVFPLGYNSDIKKRRRSHHRRNSSGTSLGKGKAPQYSESGASSPGTSGAEDAMIEDGDEDDDDFMNEKIYPFELYEDDAMDDLETALDGWDEDDEMDGEDCSDDEDWDEDDEDDETDEEEEIEEAVNAAKRAASISPTSPTGEGALTGATVPSKTTSSAGGDEPGPLSGDEDAEGEMEVDIEAYDDPSFNRELSSPTSPTASASPLSPGESMISSFYIPPVPLQVQYNAAQSWQVEQQMQQEADAQDQDQDQESHQQGEQMQEMQADSQSQELPQEQEQQPQQQHQAPVQIHLPPAQQTFIVPTSPILPLPPPRLDSIRVGYLRQTELGVKLTGRGTPTDRARAQQWARGYTPWSLPAGRRSSPTFGKRNAEGEEDVNEEAARRGRPRLRLATQDENASLHDQGQDLQSNQSNGSGLRLNLPSDVQTSSEGSMQLHNSFKGVDLRPDGSMSFMDKSSTSVSNPPSSDQMSWDLLCFDGKGSSQPHASSELHQPQHHGIVLASRSSPTPAFAAPRPGPPSPTSDSMFGSLSMGIFDMSLWFSGDTGAGDASNNASTSSTSEEQQGARTPPMNMAAGPGMESYVPMESPSAAASTSGTSTLSFALG